MQFFIFAAVFLLMMATANWYMYRRFLRKVVPDWRKFVIAVPVILMLGEIFFVVDLATGLIPETPALYFVTSAFVGITFILFVMALMYDLTITVSTRVPFDQERRKVIKIIFDVTMLIAAISYVLRGLANGIRLPAINTVPITIRDFPFARYNIVQLTDIHVGRTIKRDFVEYLVEQTNALKPDLVVITGDLVDLPIERIRYDLAPLTELQAPVYFILGNHEYFHGPLSALDHIASLGIRVLLNEAVVIGNDQQRFNLIGITDLVGERMGMLQPDLHKAYHAVDDTLPCLVLAHQPKFIERMTQHRCDLMLSGHTHGGQIFPFGFMVMMDQPYLYGLHEHAPGQQIFVSRGTGYWGPPLRVLAPSEITHLIITAG